MGNFKLQIRFKLASILVGAALVAVLWTTVLYSGRPASADGATTSMEAATHDSGAFEGVGSGISLPTETASLSRTPSPTPTMSPTATEEPGTRTPATTIHHQTATPTPSPSPTPSPTSTPTPLPTPTPSPTLLPATQTPPPPPPTPTALAATSTPYTEDLAHPAPAVHPSARLTPAKLPPAGGEPADSHNGVPTTLLGGFLLLLALLTGAALVASRPSR